MCIRDRDKDDCFDSYYTMGEVSSNREDFWSSDVNVNRNSCELKLDSGSKVTVVSDHTPWLKGLKLDPIKSEFRGPGNIKLSHLFKGQITNATLQATERTCTSCPTKRTISCQSPRYKRSGYSPQLPRYTTSTFLTSERNIPNSSKALD